MSSWIFPKNNKKHMSHIHRYNEKGEQICCTQTTKIYKDANAEDILIAENQSEIHNHAHKHGHDGHEHNHDHDHNDIKGNLTTLILPSLISFLLLISAICFDNWLPQSWFANTTRLVWYIIAYAIVAIPVIKDAFLSIKNGDIFSEFFLMTIATVGAFAIGEYPEGVAVMLFYSVGEVFQTIAVSKAKNNIKSLLDQRPDEVTIVKNNQTFIQKAIETSIGDIIQLKPGEKLALDGILLSETASFNTSALTGESTPDTKIKNDSVLAGMINLNTVSQVKVTTTYDDSKLSKILELVQNATTQKAPTELFIRKFARVYTPIVVVLAIGICFFPALFLENYIFNDWLYRALIFLVISCPCALVISIPLGYFGGIGAASKNGILFKGSNYLDAIAQIQNIVMDKTGTMTEGVFKVQEINFIPDIDKSYILNLINAVESHSTHPIATVIHEYVGQVDSTINIKETEEIPGHGLRSIIDSKEILVGNFKLLDKYQISYNINPNEIIYTTLAVAYDKKYIGYITIADSIKTDAAATMESLNKLNIKTTMLSGDKKTVVAHVAKQLGIKNYFGELLPEDKVNKVKEIKSKNETVAFVGDGVNDAPVVALSDVGIAMGGLGSDATIETADIVIQDDKPSKIPLAILIGKKTKTIVWQNITLAFVVKAIVLILGAGGLATMWEAVFADVGVSLLAILNAIRILNASYDPIINK